MNQQNNSLQQQDALEEKLVQVNRVAKVVKGGRIFGLQPYVLLVMVRER